MTGANNKSAKAVVLKIICTSPSAPNPRISLFAFCLPCRDKIRKQSTSAIRITKADHDAFVVFLSTLRNGTFGDACARNLNWTFCLRSLVSDVWRDCKKSAIYRRPEHYITHTSKTVRSTGCNAGVRGGALNQGCDHLGCDRRKRQTDMAMTIGMDDATIAPRSDDWH